jgi:glyoxylase-like metal-dependent hydrolase (beta-lactamase superfamily II)
MTEAPLAATAAFHILTAGYIRRGAEHTVASTVGYVADDDLRLVVDPGMVADRRLILDPLRAIGVEPGEVTDVVLSHHHPDHTLNAALFPNARVHDHWAVYQDDRWDSRDAEGAVLSDSVRLIRTAGHTAEDISTLVGTAGGVVAFTHAWWTAAGPAEDPYAPDRDVLRSSRERLLEIADLIVPGHGEPFRPGPDTPR